MFCHYIKQIDVIKSSDDFGIYLKDLEDFPKPVPEDWVVVEGFAKPAESIFIRWDEDQSWDSAYLLQLLKLFKGQADLILTWVKSDESGYEEEDPYHTGVRVDNGRVTQHVVDRVLGRELEPWMAM